MADQTLAASIASREDYGSVRLNFGKHSSKRIADVPVEYLLWCVNKAKASSVPKSAREAIEQYLKSDEMKNIVKEFQEGKNERSDLMISFPLSGGNRVEIRLLTRASKKDFDTILELLKLAEASIVENLKTKGETCDE